MRQIFRRIGRRSNLVIRLVIVMLLGVAYIQLAEWRRKEQWHGSSLVSTTIIDHEHSINNPTNNDNIIQNDFQAIELNDMKQGYLTRTKPPPIDTKPALFATTNDKVTVQAAYSGMWWQSVDSFLRMNTSSIVMLEDATFRITSPYRDDVIMTNDMFDFAVEHLSMYFRSLNFRHHFTNKEMAYQRCLDALHNYTKRVFSSNSQFVLEFQRNKQQQATTIAVIPVGAFGIENNNNNAGDRAALDPFYELFVQSLLTTLASIWQLGTVGRIIFVGGPTQQEYNTIHRIMDEFKNITSDFTSTRNNDRKQSQLELQFIGDRKDLSNLPKEALSGLHDALSGKLPRNETLQWLGSMDRKKWKYVYYTEPDLILHTRPQTIPLIIKELDNQKILVAHRLQLVQHESDFIDNATLDNSLVMPAVGQFAMVHSMDHLKGDQCIWTSNDIAYFDNPNKPCPSYWHECGFDGFYNKSLDRTNVPDVEAMYRSFQRFNLIRLQRGTGFVVATGTESRQICQISKQESK